MQQREASMFSRLAIWKTTVELIPARVALGYGPETFATVFADNYPPELTRLEGADKIIDDPHNLFLNQLFSTGIIGTITFLYLLFVFYRNTIKTFQHCDDKHTQTFAVSVISSLTAFLIQAQFTPNTITISMLFWLCLAFIAALSNSRRRKDVSFATANHHHQ
jgi:O-antigen ligase